MKKYFLFFICGLFFAANAVAAIPGYHPSIPPDQEPPWLAINIDYDKIISGCCSRIMTVPDIENLKDVAQIPNGEERDGIDSDPEDESIFCASGNGIPTIVQEFLSANFEVAQTVSTRQSNKARGP